MVGFPQRPRRKTGAAPVVSPTPPIRTPRRRSHVYNPESYEAGRVYAVIGARATGKTTILKSFTAEEIPGVRVLTPSDTLADDVERARRAAFEVIFVEGLPRTPEDVLTLYNERVITPASGGILLFRREAAPDPQFYNRLIAIEEMIRELSIPYFCVHTDDLSRAAVVTLNRTGLVR